jgi:hypothetical protein
MFLRSYPGRQASSLILSHVWGRGAKTTVPIAKKCFLISILFGSESLSKMAYFILGYSSTTGQFIGRCSIN